MNIVLFGGAFNPPHIGHLLIAQQVLDYTESDEVWFLPNYGQIPPKPFMASAEDRLAMTNLLRLPKTQVSTLEIDHKLDGDTINLLPFLPKEHTFTFVIGSDLLRSFPTWGKWEELLEQLPFFVFPRNGFPASPLYSNMIAVSGDNLMVTDISATKVRNRIQAGLSIDQFVPAPIIDYIKSHGLYKTGLT